LVFGAGLATIALGTGISTQLVSPVAASGVALGVYEPQQGNVSGVGGFASETGTAVGVSTQYLALGPGWSGIQSDFAYLMGLIQGMPYRLALSVPMFPTGASFGDVSSNLGTFATIAKGLVANGFANATIRLAWEFNIGTTGAQCQANPSAFVSDWQAIVNTMRAAPGQHFTFSWNSVPQVGFDISQCYPGDSYVDYVSSDPYDQDYSYNPNNQPTQSALTWSHITGYAYDGLNALATFATAHGKQLSFDEWGVGEKSDGHGLGDDPNYVNSLAAWVKANNVGYISYFDDNPSGSWNTILTNQPNSLAAYKADFGGSITATPAPAIVGAVSGTTLGAPTNVHATISGSSVVITWTQPAGQVDGNNIYRDGTKIAWPGYPNLPVTSYTDSGISVGSHTYAVSAYNPSGEGPLSAPVVVTVGSTTTTTPAAPPTTTITQPVPTTIPPKITGSLTCSITINTNGVVTGSCQ
jgi:hypothetical protein